ncbi:MAG: phosphatidylglycerophosphatase A [Alphaproteobacteria bacterium]|nr:phosphatidylglycerophosphatase A [Alphaproteobacteria bacterium]
MTPAAARLGLPTRHPAVLLATWFGAGLLPKAPGTWGSLAALPFAWLIAWLAGQTGLFIATLLVFLLGWWAAAAVCRAGGARDPGAVVIDEVAGQWLVLAAAPRTLLFYAAGFLFFRIADILKPWPASWADRAMHGGLGIMLDDVVAAAYAGAALLLIARFGFGRG